MDNLTFSQRLRQLGDDEHLKFRKRFQLIFSLLPIIGLVLLLFAPICATPAGAEYEYEVMPINCFSSFRESNDAITSFAILELLVFIVVVCTALLNFYMFIKLLMSYSNEKAVARQTKRIIIADLVVVGIITILSLVFSPINVLLDGRSSVALNPLPIIYTAVITIVYAMFVGIVSASKQKIDDERFFDEKYLERIEKKRRTLFFARIELFIYALAASGVTLIALLSNILTVTFSFKGYAVKRKIIINGWNLLFKSDTLTKEGEQGLGYVVFLFFTLVSVALLLLIVSFASRSDMFHKIGVASVSVSAGICLAIGLIGKYYDIVQSTNDGLLSEILAKLNLPELTVYKYTTASNSMYFFVACIIIVTLIFFRRPYSKSERLMREIAEEEAARLPKVIEISELPGQDKSEEKVADTSPVSVELTNRTELYADPCPAFNSLDLKKEEFSVELEERREAFFEYPTLPKLVDFVVQYARDSRLHLFYTQENIAEFFAGMGTTRLSILQGMSGTGKTSLPKIVAEALYSVCDIVEVESSWRDKNELLGYYNEFSKTYTPKKFTQALYKAALNPEVITFIVLDEMNLSRIEYYFSDFLSLMENEPDNREIKLLNTPIFKKNGGNIYKYEALIDGHTLKIPQNVWFVGTANRDESTYDISDKVYDRAHTMNFDKRAARVKYYNAPIDRKYISVSQLNELFNNAKLSLDFSIEQYPIVAEVEKLLEPYNISFGNRIAIQIESFVKIYTACFSANETVIRDALEIILLSKVVRKLELKSLEDKEALAEAFAKLQLRRCSDFILSLKED